MSNICSAQEFKVSLDKKGIQNTAGAIIHNFWLGLLSHNLLMDITCYVFSLSELYVLMKDQDTGIKEMKLEKDKKLFNHCFTGMLLQSECSKRLLGGICYYEFFILWIYLIILLWI